MNQVCNAPDQKQSVARRSVVSEKIGPQNENNTKLQPIAIAFRNLFHGRSNAPMNPFFCGFGLGAFSARKLICITSCGQIFADALIRIAPIKFKLPFSAWPAIIMKPEKIWNMKNKELEIAAATERMELYCIAHPGSPAAVRRPKLIFRVERWVAFLGRNIENGIAGFGPTVEEALSAFDTQYLNALRPPAERIKLSPSDLSRNGHDSLKKEENLIRSQFSRIPNSIGQPRAAA